MTIESYLKNEIPKDKERRWCLRNLILRKAMKISRELLREIAQRYIKTLDDEGLRTLQNLEKLVGQALPIENHPRDYIIIEWRPSNLQTRALDIAYAFMQGLTKKGGLPVVVKLNPSLGYSCVILKSQSVIPGYEHFATDPFENLVQQKTLETIEWQEVRGEVGKLAK